MFIVHFFVFIDNMKTCCCLMTTSNQSSMTLLLYFYSILGIKAMFCFGNKFQVGCWNVCSFPVSSPLFFFGPTPLDIWKTFRKI